MIDTRQLYIDLISDYDPYCNISEHENLSESEMLYNLIEMKENNGIENIESEEDQYIFDRFNTLIALFHAQGVSPYYEGGKR